jgi:hypothetical protein
MSSPYHIIDVALRCVNDRTSSDDEDVKRLLRVMHGKKVPKKDADLVYAWDKYQSPLTRNILNAFLLADATYDIIREATGIPLAVLKEYQKYFFDVDVFRDKMERIEFVEQECLHAAPQEAQFLKAAIQSGPDYIVWILNGQPKCAPREVIEHHMMEGFFRSQAHRGTEITSEVARQAHRWGQTSHRAAADLQRLDPRDDQDALAELHLRLTHDDETVNETTEDAPRPEDILH